MAVGAENGVEVFATPREEMNKVGSGIGIGAGVLNGIIVFDKEDIEHIKNMPDNDKHMVLVRPDTVPDDIELIFECDGLLTARGGATSHAAVTASSLGKICVVNCDDLIVNDLEKTCSINGNNFKLFDEIAIDGKNGLIYKGNYPISVDEN